VRLSRNNPEIELEIGKNAILMVKPVKIGTFQIETTPTKPEKIGLKIGESTTVDELKEMIDLGNLAMP